LHEPVEGTDHPLVAEVDLLTPEADVARLARDLSVALMEREGAPIVVAREAPEVAGVLELNEGLGRAPRGAEAQARARGDEVVRRTRVGALYVRVHAGLGARPQVGARGPRHLAGPKDQRRGILRALGVRPRGEADEDEHPE